MERGNFRGRGGRGFGRGRGGRHGGRGGRGRGRGGRGGRGNFGFQQRRQDDQGYTEGYASYPQQGNFGPPQGYPPQQQGYPPQQGYSPQPQYPEQYQPPYPQEPPFQQYQPQDPYQQPQYPQGYANDRGGYNNGNPLPYQPMDNFQNQPPLPPQYQQQYQPPPQQFQQPPQQYQQFQEENPRFANNPPMPPMSAPPQPETDYAGAARARQQAYAPVPPEEDSPEAPQPFQEVNRPPPAFQQPPLPQQEPQGAWNYPPPQEQQWQQPPPQQQFGGPPGYGQGPARPPMEHHQNQNPRFHDRRHDRNDHHQKLHRPPPPSYICHNCNQPGHWKQHCPLFSNEQEGFGSRQEDQLQPHFGAGPRSDQQWAPGPPVPGIKPQDPRRNTASYNAGSMENPEFARTNDPRSLPPLPNASAPPFPRQSQSTLPYDGDGYPQQQQMQHQPGQQVWRCENCVKNFVIASQYEAHLGTHVTCSDCDFSASKRVVTAHYQMAHGQYAGQGLKEIDVEGQKFMVLVGNSAEDISKWREERRKKWLAMSRQPKPTTTTPESAPVAGKRKLSISSEEDLEEGEIEEDEEAKAQIALQSTARNVATPDSGPQEPPAKKQRKMVLCKWFSRGHCRFDEAHCKYSHDRTAFGCRAMMYKGSCSKGMYCPFSHDTAVLSGQRERSQKASKERATEQQWRGEQKSLLRKLLAKDVRAEQRKMLQIAHFLVANQFLRSSDEEKADVSVKEPAVRIEVLKSDESNVTMNAEASDPIKSVSKDIVMEEASDDVKLEQASTEEFKSATTSEVVEPSKVVADDNVVPIVEAAACKPESRGVSKIPATEESDAILPSHDGDEVKIEAAKEEGENMKHASSNADAESVGPEEVAAAVPSKDVELAVAALDNGKEPAQEVDQADTLETSVNEANEAC
ncbi:hypothetical protein PHMEG_0003276 [Phytophthora megakarya]|uniref:Nuclear fragile X mental retardation-interacting protein 1 n=1 Tax=Phytophthora megakarya TaxID=4795 RepID=A0A225WWL4_9STRA|nr:hypothetical protein PHMEG_0003276 [Phytophthora megakarya]